MEKNKTLKQFELDALCNVQEDVLTFSYSKEFIKKFTDIANKQFATSVYPLKNLDSFLIQLYFSKYKVIYLHIDLVFHKMEPEKQKNNLDHALLMEDDEACQKIMHYYLRELKYQVDLTNDGSSAIQFIENFTYDLIIVDIRLYGTSGKDVIQYVRDSELNTDTLLIVWSAFVNKNDEEKFLSWGADGALVKWDLPNGLKNLIQKCLKKNQ